MSEDINSQLEYEFTPANKIAIGLITLGCCIIAVIVYFVRC